ncbi:hypothetical protein FHD46_00600 [Escherichia coli]|nr:hypothetical protein C1192_07135 [Escherichia marmotae]EFB2833924.1 hypothetical protein [Escherichia coli]EGE0246970.1 hypothetical protein [Escherichia coli]MIA79201.1 hypothetical protein [Escherichia coli]PSS41282.1 hypothetical protein BEM40_007735 [Escherichia sp. MOD1-EC5451]
MVQSPGEPGFEIDDKRKMPDALRLSDLQDNHNVLNLRDFVGRIRRSCHIRHEQSAQCQQSENPGRGFSSPPVYVICEKKARTFVRALLKIWR